MIKSIYFPDKTFATKEDLFADFRENVETIIDAKKAEIQKSCEKGLTVTCKSLDLMKFSDQLKGIKIDDNFWYIAVNSTRILDSHQDLHLDGLWGKSVKEQQGQNYLVCDHVLDIDKVVVKKQYVEMLTALVPFSLIGKEYEGETQALIYKVPKDKVIHEKANDWLKSGDPIEASVRMQYVDVLFAMDSNDPKDAAAKKNYDDYFKMIANKKDFEYIPYFFAIKQAKNVRESSLVVFASNSATGNMNSNIEPPAGTQKEEVEPLEDTPVVKSFYSHFLN